MQVSRLRLVEIRLLSLKFLLLSRTHLIEAWKSTSAGSENLTLLGQFFMGVRMIYSTWGGYADYKASPSTDSDT